MNYLVKDVSADLHNSQEGDRGVEKNLRYDHRREKSR